MLLPLFCLLLHAPSLLPSLTSMPLLPHAACLQFLEDMFGYKYSMLGACVGVLVAFCALFAICATVAFKRLNFQKR